MTDVTTNKPLQVSTNPVAGPYLTLPLDQLKEVRKLLEDHGLHCEVEEYAISWEDGPFIAYVILDRGVDPNAVQAILDGAP